MIHSMTAFARESTNTALGTLSLEIRSVNHRYLDCTLKAPETLRSLEPVLREQLSKVLNRGKVECFIRIQSHSGTTGAMQINEARLNEVLQAAQQIHKQTLRQKSMRTLLKLSGRIITSSCTVLSCLE